MALASEFQRKQQLEAKQYQELHQTAKQGPKEHPEDTLIVRNILVGDNTEVEDVIPYANARPGVDPSTGGQHFVNQIETNVFEYSWNTSEYFEVRWDGRPHRIKAGETRRMPRYLGDHFAKYLIDFILMHREEKEKVTGLLKNRLERAKLYKQIIIGVDSYYNGDMYDFGREGNFVEQQVQDLNRADNAINLGEVPNIALGYGTTDKAPESTANDFPLAPPMPDLVNPVHPGSPTTQEDLIASKTIHQLRSEAKQLGIEVKPTMTKEQLSAAILNF
jgi:hypothetical protein